MKVGRHTLAAAASLIALLAGAARAQRVTGLYGFGDSLTDTHGLEDLLGGPAALPGLLASYPGAPNYSNGTNYFNNLTSYFGLPPTPATNYAIAGAQSGSTNVLDNFVPTLPGYEQEIAKFLATGMRLSPTDLVTTTLGTNDGFLLPADATPGEIAAAAQHNANVLGAGTAALVQRGGRQFVFISGENTSVTPLANTAGSVRTTPAVEDPLIAEQYADDERVLAPFAAPGIRVDVLNLSALEQRVAANPGAYGFRNGTDGCAFSPACGAAPLAVQDEYFFWDLHPSQGGYALIARYVEAQLAGQSAPSAAGNAVLSTARDIAAAIETHLDTPADDGPPWRVYLQGLYGAGGSGGRSYASGYGYDLGGVLAGADYAAGPALRLGGAFAYGNSSGTLNGGAGSFGLNDYTFSAYGVWQAGPLFASLTAGYSIEDFDHFSRPGVTAVGGASARPAGDAVTVSGRAHYLVPLGPAEAGPVVGLDYVHVGLNGYTERGDFFLAQAVRSQSLDPVTGLAGAEIRLKAGPLLARLDALAAEDFNGTSRQLDEALVDAPLVVNRLDVAGESRLYGVFDASLDAPVARGTDVGAFVHARVAGRGENDTVLELRAQLRF